MLDSIHIVLVETSHPGNIGAAARAIKNMGLSHLRLVKPQKFPSGTATARASGAIDILQNAQIYESLADAIADCSLVFGTSARERSIAWTPLTPRMCAEKALEIQKPVALVFGREHSGLTNEELDLCHYAIRIPTNPQFSSLNVAAAVQVLCYELHCQEQLLSVQARINELPEAEEPPVSAETMHVFYQHLEQTLIEIGFLDPENPRQLMRRLQRFFNRAQPTEIEMNILRGVLTAAQGKGKYAIRQAQLAAKLQE